MALLVTESRTMDLIFRNHARSLGEHLPIYRGHCYRILNYTLALNRSQGELKLLEVATAFHDLGIWTSKTMDYLQPSSLAAERFVLSQGLAIDLPRLKMIILDHHKLSNVVEYRLAEYFRRADLVDLTFGMLKYGLKKSFVDLSRKKWPYDGFQKMIFGKVLWHALGHPNNPLPMIKW